MRKIMLSGVQNLEIKKAEKLIPEKGDMCLKVEFCGVCRTDAKMWEQGHKDLVLPRVPGHEAVCLDETGKRFAVWPGRACGKCRYCTSNRENLCDDMQIMGFHRDGGFADELTACKKNLIPLPDHLPAHLACFAEPAGCVLNALSRPCPLKGDRVIIYGGGTMGMITALVCQSAGAHPLIIEKNQDKIKKTEKFLRLTGIDCVQNTSEKDFDLAVNACADPAAFGSGMEKLARGGRFSFFSGLLKHEAVQAADLNCIHYKELAVYGAYGLKQADMEKGLFFIADHEDAFERLIEDIIPLEDAVRVMPEVVQGAALKYILAV